MDAAPTITPDDKAARFGNGATAELRRRAAIPTCLCGACGRLNVSISSLPHPDLFSPTALRGMSASIDFQDGYRYGERYGKQIPSFKSSPDNFLLGAIDTGASKPCRERKVSCRRFLLLWLRLMAMAPRRHEAAPALRSAPFRGPPSPRIPSAGRFSSERPRNRCSVWLVALSCAALCPSAILLMIMHPPSDESPTGRHA